MDEGFWDTLIDSIVGSQAKDGNENKIDFETFKQMMKKFTENEHITQSIKFN
jgi:hypothetical protein